MKQFLIYALAILFIIFVVYMLFKVFWKGDNKIDNDNDDPSLWI